MSRQRVLLLLCGVTLTLIVVATWLTLAVSGSFGGHLQPTRVPFVERLTSIEPGSPIARAGVRDGDTIDLRDLPAPERLRLRNGPLAGERYLLPIRRDGVPHPVVVTAAPTTSSRFWREDGWDQLLSMAGEFWAAFVGGLIIWRRPGNAGAVILALSLILANLGTAISPFNYWLTPWPLLDMLTYALGVVLESVGSVLLATYALRFGRPISRTRRLVTWCAYAFAALGAVSGLTSFFGEWLGAVDSSNWLLAQPLPSLAIIGATNVLPLICVALAVRAARGSERAQVAWAGGSLGIQYLAAMLFMLTQYFGAFNHAGDLTVDIATFIAPAGLTYALLNRRLLDVGFALNRAAVFTAISLAIVGAFTLGEWALGNWLQSANKVTNLAASAGLALVLGLSIHPIHAWVDRFVDNVFFRKRHADEQALRRFAHEAAFTTDAAAIVERAKRELSEHAGSSSVDVVLFDGAHRYGGIDENDLALVALRASGEPLELTGLETALRGERVYPMLARGRLIGALVIGPKRSGETYAPDESAAIAEVAHGAGVALDLLGVGRDDTSPALVDAIVALDRSVRALPDALYERLREREPI